MTIKKFFAVIAVTLIGGLAQAGVVFDNGAPADNSYHCISGPNVCMGSGTWTVYDQFSLDSPTTVGGFANWNLGQVEQFYSATNWSIWTSTPTNGGTPLYAGSSKATLSFDRGYVLATVDGLSLDLAAGSYWLGITHVLSWHSVWTYAVSGNGQADALALDESTYAFDSLPDMAFVVTGVVPEPQTYAMMLAGLGLAGAVARRRKRVFEGGSRGAFRSFVT